ncbi:MAG: MFS transporter [Chloroflexi bacterium]|nr:MFS transporter [Chloroflexota bacterium]
MRPWAAFTFRDYRYLWATGLATVVSRWMRILVTAQWLFEETDSAALLGFIGGVQLVVQIPALLWGGALADYMNRKHLVAVAHTVTFAVLLALGLLAAADLLTVWQVYVAIGITAATQVISQPAAAALTPAVVPRRHLMLAITGETATMNAGSILAPLLFAGVAEWFGLTAAFFVAAGTTAPAALLPLFIHARGQVEQRAEGSTVRRVWEGFLFVIRHPILPGLFLLDIGITVVSFYREILPVIAKGLFKGGAGAVGVLGSANSAGAVAGSFGALFFAGYRSKGMLVIYASLAYAVVLLVFSNVTVLWAGAITIALLGLADAVTVAVRQTTVQLTTPDHMRGRATAFLVLAAVTANNVGTLWVGLWSEWIGEAATMTLGAFLAFGATLLIWRMWRPLREYRYP